MLPLQLSYHLPKQDSLWHQSPPWVPPSPGLPVASRQDCNLQELHAACLQSAGRDEAAQNQTHSSGGHIYTGISDLIKCYMPQKNPFWLIQHIHSEINSLPTDVLSHTVTVCWNVLLLHYLLLSFMLPAPSEGLQRSCAAALRWSLQEGVLALQPRGWTFDQCAVPSSSAKINRLCFPPLLNCSLMEKHFFFSEGINRPGVSREGPLWVAVSIYSAVSTSSTSGPKSPCRLQFLPTQTGFPLSTALSAPNASVGYLCLPGSLLSPGMADDVWPTSLLKENTNPRP